MNSTLAFPSNFSISPSNRILIIPLQKSRQTIPTYFDCDNHVINFTYKKWRVFDTGQWRLRVHQEGQRARLGAVAHSIHGTSFCDLTIAM